MAKYLRYIYIPLSIYVLVQTSFFPEKIAQILMYVFEPRLNGRAALSSPGEIARYYNIVVYSGLGISCLLFLTGIKLFLNGIFKNRQKILRFAHLSIHLLIFASVFLCGIKVFRLIRGNNMGLFHLPLETATVMVTLMVLIACDFLRRRNNTNAPDKTQENG